jgi:site-specific DNA recombinase
MDIESCRRGKRPCGTATPGVGRRPAPASQETQPAVGYVRVSTDEQAREGLSLEAQAAAIRAFCAAQGLKLADVFVEAGASGKSLDRPQLRDVLERIRAGQVGAVIVAKLDRLTRRTRDLLALVEDVFRRHGVQLVSLGEHLDTRTPAGVLTLTMLGAVAQMEREQIGERTRAALAYKRALGERVGTVPLGFQSNEAGGPMLPVPAELEVVRHILARREAGAAFRVIAAELKTRSVPTKRGGRWHASTVRAVWHGRDRYTPLLQGSGMAAAARPSASASPSGDHPPNL